MHEHSHHDFLPKAQSQQSMGLQFSRVTLDDRARYIQQLDRVTHSALRREWPTDSARQEALWGDTFIDFRQRISARQDMFCLEFPDDKRPTNLAGYGIAKRTGFISEKLIADLYEQNRDITPECALINYRTHVAPTFPPECRDNAGDVCYYSPQRGPFHYNSYRNNHDPAGSVVALLMVETNLAFAHLGFAHQTNIRLLQWYRAAGATVAFGFARLPGLGKLYAEAAEGAAHLQHYVCETRPQDGLHPDGEIRFHQRSGGRVVCGLRYCANDPASLNHGALIVYNLNELPELPDITL